MQQRQRLRPRRTRRPSRRQANCQTLTAAALDAAKPLAETEGSQGLRKLLADIKGNGLKEYIWEQFLLARIPKFLYFSEYYQMQGEVNLEALKERVAANKQREADWPMLGLIDAARLNIDELIAPKEDAGIEEPPQWRLPFISPRKSSQLGL